jgi:hypothetical protein
MILISKVTNSNQNYILKIESKFQSNLLITDIQNQITVHSGEISLLKDNMEEAEKATTILKTDFEGIIKLAVFILKN